MPARSNTAARSGAPYLADSGHTLAFILCTRSLRNRSRIANDFDRGAGNQAAGDHLVKVRNQLFNLLFSVNDTHHDGNILEMERLRA